MMPRRPPDKIYVRTPLWLWSNKIKNNDHFERGPIYSSDDDDEEKFYTF